MARARPSIAAYFLSAGAALTLLLVLTSPGYAQGLAWYEALAFHAIGILVPLAIALRLAGLWVPRVAGGPIAVWLVLAGCGALAALVSAPFLLGAEIFFAPEDVDGDTPT